MNINAENYLMSGEKSVMQAYPAVLCPLNAFFFANRSLSSMSWNNTIRLSIDCPTIHLSLIFKNLSDHRVNVQISVIIVAHGYLLYFSIIKTNTITNQMVILSSLVSNEDQHFGLVLYQREFP